MTNGRDRQDNHIKAQLATQQILNIIHNIIMYVLDMQFTGLLTTQLQHFFTGINMNHGCTGL